MGANIAPGPGAGPIVSGGRDPLGQVKRRVRTLSPNSNKLDELLKIQKDTFDRASTYTKVIVGLAYAGFFTIWSGTRDLMKPFDKVSSALLVTLSLLVFVAYEIFEMLQRAALLNDFQRAIRVEPASLEAELTKYSRAELGKTNTLLRTWRVSLWLTIVPGVLAGLILMKAFVIRVWAMR